MQHLGPSKRQDATSSNPILQRFFWGLFTVCAVSGWGLVASAQEVSTVTCRCVADTSVLATGPDDALANLGASPRLLLGGPNRLALFQFDISELMGAEITRATLRVHRETELLTRVGVSTVSGTWVEGTRDGQRRSEMEHTTHAPADGASFRFSCGNPEPSRVQEWAWAGGNLLDVTFGAGGSRWASVIASFDKQSRWYEIDIPPALIQSIAQGLQPPSLCLMDEFGRGEPIVAVSSRETEKAPHLIVELRRSAKHPSAPPSGLVASVDRRGLEWFQFEAPQALGFEIFLAAQEPNLATDLSHYEKLAPWTLPSPGKTPRRMLLSALRSGFHTHIGVRVCESYGDWSEIVWTRLPPRVDRVPPLDAPKLKRYALPNIVTGPFTMDDGPTLSLDGRWIRSDAKTWWHPTEGPIRLETGRNEFVAFQVVLGGRSGVYRVTLADWQSPGVVEPAPRAEYFKAAYVRARVGQDKYAPDPLIPIQQGEVMNLEFVAAMPDSPPAGPPSDVEEDAVEDTATGVTTTSPSPVRVAQVIWIDLYIPRAAAVGTWSSRLIVLCDGATQLDIPLELAVREAVLPDTIGFPIELRSEAPPGVVFHKEEDSDAAWKALSDAHRLAHLHRATLLVQPYKRNGSLYRGLGPKVVPGGSAPRLDFSEWDERYGRFLDGSAFRDLPREAQPVTHFQLPFHENWPVLLHVEHTQEATPIRDKYHYRPTFTEPKSGQQPNPRADSYIRWPIELAVSAEHGKQNRALLRQFLDHLVERGWTRPEYHVSLVNHPRRGEISSWWSLGAPQVVDDLLALRYFLRPYREAIVEVSGVRARIRQTADDPSVLRGMLDGIADAWLVGTSLATRNYAVFPRSAQEQVWRHEDDIRPEMGLAGVYRWAWDGRLSGATGLTVRQSLGGAQSWERADDAAFLYPGAQAALREPVASMRLKALRRAQQDFEWLELWRKSDAAAPAEGYYLGVLGQELIERTEAQVMRAVTLTPILRLPPALDTVVFEELRRGMRTKARNAR